MNQKWVDLSFDLYRVYGARGKSYHGLQHIEECFAELNAAITVGLVENEEAMRLAIWYHDYFQDHENDDEEKSAKKGYEAALYLGYPESFAQIVHRLIMVTKHSAQYEPVTPDEMLMVDIDLAPFAADNFMERFEWVRMEYPEVPIETFIEARRGILAGFLALPHIYRTPYMRERLEAAARRNLAIAIEPPK